MPSIQTQSILVTGGTGSFGTAFTRAVLETVDVRRLIIYSRDELKQSEMRHDFQDDPRLRFFIGDVRDEARLTRAMHEVDVVIHAAALKQIVAAEYNPFECIQTNVIGAQNVVNAAINADVGRVIALSTDKASSPTNLYGATKLASDKLFVAANHYAAHGTTRFAVVRYGNVMGSRGSVIPLFRRLAPTGTLPITDKRMTRFWITLQQAVSFVLNRLEDMGGGEIFVPKIPSMRIVDLATAIAPDASLEEVGIRPGEKLHEEMISEDDARRTIDLGTHYAILPVHADWGGDLPSGPGVREGFTYRSDTNERWLDPKQLAALMDHL